MRYDNYMDMLLMRRPGTHHLHMDIPHRAKQFAPFAALKGFEDCVYAREILYVEKADIAEDRQTELNFRLRMLQYGTRITAVYFQPDQGQKGKGHYTTLTGMVTALEPEHYLQIDGTMIPLEHLRDIIEPDIDSSGRKGG